MVNWKALGAMLLSTLLVASSLQKASAMDADERRKAAAVVGVIVGAAALAAASRDHRHEHHRAHSGSYQPRPNVAPFSPKAGVTCYPRERTCYHRNGSVSNNMTATYFGARPARPGQPFRVQEANGNVTCYPQERACYRANGKFAGKWTRRYFGG
jgi:hypothetical protein